MKILVINSGSSSLKFKLFEKTNEIAEGHIDGINLKKCKFTFKNKEKNTEEITKVKTHEKALELALKTLISTKTIETLKEITAVGHRVVHGGEKYINATIIDTKVIKKIKELEELAPLHNPKNLEGILACKKMLAKTKQVAIFDTAFYQSLEQKAYLYGLPYEWYEKHGIRKYGFHGTNHEYVIKKAEKLLKNKKLKIVSCHLGNGSSITASKNGKSIDTSMGFTPLDGVIMGTRCGSIDPSIILYIGKKLKLKPEKINEILNNESGLKGLSKISSDMRDIYERYLKKDKFAKLSIELLSYQVAKHIGAYTAALNGIDCIIFTGGMGEKAFYVREKVCEYFEHLGLKLDKKNNTNSTETISDKKSKIKVLIITANEEEMIAEKTLKLIKN